MLSGRTGEGEAPVCTPVAGASLINDHPSHLSCHQAAANNVISPLVEIDHWGERLVISGGKEERECQQQRACDGSVEESAWGLPSPLRRRCASQMPQSA